MGPRSILKCIVIHFVLVTFISVFATYAFADFTDNFTNPLTTNWSVYSNGGFVTSILNNLTISAPPSHSFPYLYLNNDVIPQNNYNIETRIKMYGSLTYGAGIVFTDHLLNNNISSDVGWDDAIFHFWPVSSNTYKLFANPCPENVTSCVQDKYRGTLSTFNDDSWHKLNIKYSDNTYSVYIDDILVFRSAQSNKKITHIWIGNPQYTNTINTWPTIEISYIKITNNSALKPPIILIPGFGASWDYGAILKNENSSNWQMPSWVTTYDNLLLSLEKVGYKRDDNLFVYTYDWRKPLVNLADDFDNYIDSLSSTGKLTGKVDLIGHSMGGLVARSYIQKYGADKVDKVITAGTPHEGVIQAYPAWEGAQIRNFNWYQRFVLELLLMINKKPTESQVQEVRRLVPSIKDFLPTFDYLFRNGRYISYIDQKQQNDTLQYMNNNLLVISPILEAIYGTDQETLTRINVTTPDWIDKILDRWEDGKPTQYLNTYQGDGAVLTSSALSNFHKLAGLPLNHGETISSSDAISAIFDSLKLDKSSVTAHSEAATVDQVLVVALRSPGQIQIVDSNDNEIGKTINDKLVFVTNPNNQLYNIKLRGDGGSGTYTLSVGLLAPETTSWKHFTGVLRGTDLKTYPIMLEHNQITIDPQTNFETVVKDYLVVLNDFSANNLLRQTQNTKLTTSKFPHLLNLKIRLHELYKLSVKNNQTDKTNQIAALLPIIDDWIEKLEKETKTKSHLLTGGNINPVNSLKNVCEIKIKTAPSVAKADIYENANNILGQYTQQPTLSISRIWLDSAFLWFKDCVEL